jgi:hypothetical protein
LQVWANRSCDPREPVSPRMRAVVARTLAAECGPGSVRERSGCGDLASRPDVLVVAKKVGRVIPRFDLRQALIVRPVRRFSAVHAFVANTQEIDVYAAWRERLHRLPQLT